MDKNHINPFKRLAAYAVDWYICTMLCGAPLMLVNSMHTGLQTVDTSLPAGASGWLWGLVALAIGVCYYFLLPHLWHRQTLAKRLFHLRITDADGNQPTLAAMFKRQVVGVLLLEGAVAFPSQLLRELLCRAVGDRFTNILRITAVIISIFSICMGLYAPDKLMVHDRYAKTREISTD